MASQGLSFAFMTIFYQRATYLLFIRESGRGFVLYGVNAFADAHASGVCVFANLARFEIKVVMNYLTTRKLYKILF